MNKYHPWKEFPEKPTFFSYNEGGRDSGYTIIWIILLLLVCLGSVGLIILAGGG